MSMQTSWSGGLSRVLLVLACSLAASAQAQQQPLPDAPNPQQTFPPARTTPPPGESSSRDDDGPPRVDNRVDQPDNNPPAAAETRDVPGTKANTPDQERLYKVSVSTNFVEIPVTVKDSSGRMVPGLLPKDFTVYENGTVQKLAYFTSDPLPISAAVLIDVSMPDTALRRVQEGLQALQGAFSQYDEVAVYTYGSSVTRESGFSAANARLTEALNRVVERKHGDAGGVAMTGPMEAGPSVNGHSIYPGQPQNPIPRDRDRRVLNDAVLEAALDLSKVPPARRRVIMVIGDGREEGSRASYSDVLKILLTNKIGVFPIAVGSGGIPVYRKLETINLPGTGTGNILPKYANATGGEVFSEFTREAIQGAYARVTDVARNQYTLGYYTQGSLAENYREIEVRVARAGLRVNAKAGYYPLPPGRQ
jgi:VWFA-related protein